MNGLDTAMTNSVYLWLMAWVVLIIVASLADRFAGWLWQRGVAHRSARRIRGLVHELSARWG
jgi:threonine/homoserine/homoserine lactone efflux protein